MRSSDDKNIGFLYVAEINYALMTCIKISRRMFYVQSRNKFSSTDGKRITVYLIDIITFITSILNENKHKIILPPRHHITKLIIMAQHLRLLHATTHIISTASILDTLTHPSGYVKISKRFDGASHSQTGFTAENC